MWFFGVVCVQGAILLSLTNRALADPTSARGVSLAQACAACHGPDGRSQGAIPSLNTISRENFVAALQAFRAGERQGTVMNRIAKGLDDADIAAVAAYFLTLRQR